jgi:hypothetical protein
MHAFLAFALDMCLVFVLVFALDMRLVFVLDTRFYALSS